MEHENKCLLAKYTDMEEELSLTAAVYCGGSLWAGSTLVKDYIWITRGVVACIIPGTPQSHYGVHVYQACCQPGWYQIGFIGLVWILCRGPMPYIASLPPRHSSSWL